MLSEFLPDSNFMAEFKEDNCSNCPFCERKLTAPQVPGVKPDLDNVRAMFIGEAPGKNEAEQGLPFVGRAGNQLRSMLRSLGIGSGNIIITNVVKCRPKDNKTPTQKESSHCRKLLEWELEQASELNVPIITLGKVATNAVLGNNDALTKYVGSGISTDYGMVYPTYHPAYILRNPNMRHISMGHIASALNTTGEFNKHPVLTHITDINKLMHELSTIDKPTLTIDLETNMLDPFYKGANITVIGIKIYGYDDVTYHIDLSDIGKFSSWLKKNSEDVAIIAHNAQFDMLWLLVFNIIDIPTLFNLSIWDTKGMLAMKDEESNTSLKKVAPIMFNVNSWDIPIDDKTSGNIDDIIPYNALDLYYTEKIMAHTIKDKYLLGMWKKIKPSIAMVVAMRYYGMRISMEELENVDREVINKADEIEEFLSTKYKLDNPRSGDQIAKIVYEDFGVPINNRTPTGKPSTNKNVLIAIRDVYNNNKKLSVFIDKLSEYKTNQKIASTYTKGYYKLLERHRPEHSTFLHPTYHPFPSPYGGTVTGRLSSSKPNFQNQPPIMIRTYQSRFNGGMLLEPDLSQIELRILAHCSEDANLIDMCNTGDLHEETAKMVIDKVFPDLPPKNRRVVAKTVNFGIIYMISAKGLRSNLDNTIPINSAYKLLNMIYKRFPGVRDWQNKIKHDLITTGEVKNLFGRIRHMPGCVGMSSKDMERTSMGRRLWRQGVNAPIQGGASDLMLYGILSELFEIFLDKKLKSVIIGNVHDSLVIDMHPAEKEVVYKAIDYVMSNPRLPGSKERWDSFSPVSIKYDMEVLNND